MAGTRPNAGPHSLFDVASTSRIIQKCDMLFPWQADHHPQAVPVSKIQKPSWRHSIRANSIDIVRGHFREIARNDSLSRILMSVVSWTKCSVGHPTDIHFAVAYGDELPADARAFCRRIL